MSFVCPICKAESHNPRDEAERYCGRCHGFVDDLLIDRITAMLDAASVAIREGKYDEAELFSAEAKSTAELLSRTGPLEKLLDATS